ncbi:oligosaccharide flippase family protein [Gracilimonas sp.]|uniref:lipopolysaccharide biosynthesis protein n=1 Tax=Gracilimonas sp. TaxID=1974203 RepID=UPI0032F0597C
MSTSDQSTKRTLIGDVAKVATGTAVAQGISVLISPIITRLYSPEAFGVLGLFLSVVGIVSVNSTFRYHLAILLPDDDKDASALSGLSFLSTLCVSLLTGLVIFLFSSKLEIWFDISINPIVLAIIPAAILIDACLLILRQWHIRMQSYTTAATSEASQSLGTSGGQLGFGFSGFVEGIFLVYSNISGLFISLAIYLKTLPQKRIFFSKSMFDWERIKQQAIEHKKFFQYSTVAGVINKLAWELPSFMLTGFFSTTILGYYVLGHRLLRLPISLIGGAIGEVYYERGAKAYKQGTLNEITELVQRRLVQVGFFPFFVLTFIGEDLFIAFFGIEWAQAGVYSQILAMWTFVWFLSSPNTTIYSITNNQDKMFNIQVLLFVLRFIGLGIGGLMGSPVLAISLFAIAGIVGYGILLIQISNIAKVSPLLIIHEILSIWPACVLFSIVISAGLIYDLNSWWISAIGILAVISFYPYIFLKEPELRTMMRRIL